MLRQFTSRHAFRGTARVASLATAVALAIAFAAPARLNAQEAAANNGAFTHESLKDRLVGLGYEPKTDTSTTNTPIYVLDFQQGNFRYVINVALSSDQKLLFLDAPLKKFADPAAVPADRLLRLFEENTNISPMSFRYDKTYQQMYLTHSIANEGFSPTRLRKVIGDFMQTASNSQPLWNPNRWQPAESAAAAEAVQVDPASDLGHMQGKWAVASAVVKGQEVPAENLKQFQVVIVGKKLTMMNVDFTLELDEAASPKTIDNVQIDTGAKEVGIYELTGDSLTICLSFGSQERPAGFVASEKTTLMRLEREAPAVSVATQ